MLTNQKNKKGWRLLGLWILANAVGWALGTLTGVMLTWAFSLIPAIEGERVLPYAVLLSLGLSIGAAESVIMRWFDITNSHWVSGTLVGFVFYILFAIFIDQVAGWIFGVWDDFVVVVFFGFAIGISQWWILKKYFRNSGLWVSQTLGDLYY